MPNLDPLRGVPEPAPWYRKGVWAGALLIGLLILGWFVRTAFEARQSRVSGPPPRTEAIRHAAGPPKELARLNGVHPLPEPAKAVNTPESTAVSVPAPDQAVQQLAQMRALIDDLRRELEAKSAQAPAKASPKPTPAQPRQLSEAERERREYEKARDKARQSLQTWSRGEDRESSIITPVKPYASPYTLAGGTSVACSTRQALTSKIAGPFRVDVTAHHYDTVSGQHLLLPQGSWLILEQSGGTLFGQTRLNATVKAVHWPNGQSAKPAGAALTDTAGKAGLTQHVDQHWGRLFASVLLTGVLRGGTQAFMSASGADIPDRMAGSVAQETAAKSTQKIQQFIDTTPTIEVDNAFPCQIFLTENLSLAQPYTSVQP